MTRHRFNFARKGDDPFRTDGRINIRMFKQTMLLASLLIFLATVTSLHGACEFTCPRGHHKIPSGRKSEVNGCGVQGMSVNIGPDLTPVFTEICNEHDRCYGRCGAPKDQCDKEFSREMNKYCETQRKRSTDLYQKCQGIAALYTTGVVTLGCSFYLDAQRQGCICERNRSML